MSHLDEGTLQAWLDRDRSGIGDEEIRRIEQHLSRCEPCAARAQELRDLDRRAHSILDTGGPEGVGVPDYETVVARAESKGSRANGPMGVGRKLAWAASVVCALGLGWLANEVRDDSGSVATAIDQTAVARAADTAEPGPEPSPPSSPGEETDAVQEAAGGGAESGVEEDPAAGSGLADAVTETEERVRTGSVVVAGRVLDDRSGTPVASAQVSVPDLGTGVLTASDGSFTLELPTRTDSLGRPFAVVAQRLGYGNATRELPLDGRDTVSVDFRVDQTTLALSDVATPGTAGRSRAPSALEPDGRAQPDPTADGPAADAAAPLPDTPAPFGIDRPLLWREVGRDITEVDTGYPIATIPELEVLGVEITEDVDPVRARVRQALPDGSIVSLLHVPDPEERLVRRIGSDRPVGWSRLDGVVVLTTGPVSGDSLQALAERAR